MVNFKNYDLAATTRDNMARTGATGNKFGALAADDLEGSANN